LRRITRPAAATPSLRNFWRAEGHRGF
jgi:hypothetical protein